MSTYGAKDIEDRRGTGEVDENMVIAPCIMVDIITTTTTLITVNPYSLIKSKSVYGLLTSLPFM